VGDRDAIEGAIRDVRPEAVLHFAASSCVGESMSQPGKYYRNNVTASLTLLEAMVATGVSRIVLSSTCATYGTPAETPISEDTPQDPINTYGRTKLVIERMIDAFEAAHGTKSVCLRYFNACGADPEGETGELHECEPHLIPRAIFSALGQVSDFSVFGDDYATPGRNAHSGLCSRHRSGVGACRGASPPSAQQPFDKAQSRNRQRVFGQRDHRHRQPRDKAEGAGENQRPASR
jgi:UDP-glucose 4-epimerase